MRLIIGLIFSGTIGIVAYKKKSLNQSGLIGATVLGTFIFYFGGLIPSSTMVAFFISSSILSKVSKHYRKDVVQAEKGDERDFVQVLANGGIALLMLTIYFFTKDYNFLVGSCISFAVSNADTWGSELGVLSKGKTYQITTFKEIDQGTSGGVSIFGTVASIAGSIFIAGVFGFFYLLFNGFTIELFVYSITIGAFGFLGSLIDSLIGATIQAAYVDSLGNVTESKLDKSGHFNTKTKGFKSINNDVVNFLSNGLSTIFGTAFLLLTTEKIITFIHTIL